MSDNLPVKLDELPTIPQKFGDEAFDMVSKAGDFFPRVQLMTSNSNLCKGGEFPTNHYAFIEGDSHRDLGKNVDILVLAFRPKALDTNDPVISTFDPNSPEFQRIQEKSNVQNSGCMFGPEFLVWVPSVKKFGTFFLGSKSARRESPNVKARIGQPATLQSRKVETPQYTWFTPSCVPCSTPFDMPGRADLDSAVEKFNNPQESQIERVEETESEEARAR